MNDFVGHKAFLTPSKCITTHEMHVLYMYTLYTFIAHFSSGQTFGKIVVQLVFGTECARLHVHDVQCIQQFAVNRRPATMPFPLTQCSACQYKRRPNHEVQSQASKDPDKKDSRSGSIHKSN